jgi:hypothetical protein
MKRIQPVRVTYRNGTRTEHAVDMHNLYGELLSKLDMDKVAGIEYGEAILKTGFATEIKPSDIDLNYRGSEQTFYLDLHHNDKRLAFVKFSPVKLQQHAVHLLQQTTYRFSDTADAYEEAKFRLDGLDK